MLPSLVGALQASATVLSLAAWSWRASQNPEEPELVLPAFEEWLLRACPAEEIKLPAGPSTAPSDPAQIHVAYASDRVNFAGLLGSVISLARHLGKGSNCSIHIFVPQVDTVLAHDLRDCLHQELRHLQVEATVMLYAAPEPRFNIHNLSRFPAWVQRTTCSFSSTNNSHNCPEPSVRQYFRDENAPTFNAGVLMINLELWRSGGITRQLEQWTLTLEGLWGDQLPLNLEFQGRYLRLDWRWNRAGVCLWAGQRLPGRCLTEAKILHLNGESKPWIDWRSCQESKDVFDGLYDKCTSLLREDLQPRH